MIVGTKILWQVYGSTVKIQELWKLVETTAKMKLVELQLTWWNKCENMFEQGLRKQEMLHVV